MIDDFWNMFFDIKKTERYYWHYKIRSEKLQRSINAFLAISTCTGVASLVIWKQFWFVWAGIIAISQIVGAIQYLFPYSRQIVTINFLLPDLNKLINEIDHTWGTIGNLNISEINDYIFSYRNQLDDLTNKYIGDTYFPQIKRLNDRSDNETDMYLQLIRPINNDDKEN